MNESAGKTTSCLAITEKKTHRPGGCVGIIFQLFDWNRRFAKKKLFSKKLLPPARAKQASKKFGGDEKMPKTKLHLIADENSGGFPNMKKNRKSSVDLDHKHETRAPGLVARLMGLESMPAIVKDKPKKAPSFSGVCEAKQENLGGNHSGPVKENFNLEKGSAKHELRPQKLQKTGPSERRAVTRFGAEALHFKSVLSRSRKHHHQPKLTSPVKSPKICSGRNAARTSRLIDAATKILEPGLQATSRAKCALSYSSSMHYPLTDEIMTEGTGVLAPDLLKQFGCDATSLGKSVMGQTSCKNCGNLLETRDLRPNVQEQPSGFASSPSNFGNTSSKGLGVNKSRPPVISVEQEKDFAFQKSRDQPLSFHYQMKDIIQACCEPFSDGKPLSKEPQEQWSLSSQSGKPQKLELCPFGFKHRTQTQSQMPLGRERIPPRSKLSNLQSRRASSSVNATGAPKDFVALNRNLSSHPRQRVPAKVHDTKIDTERKYCNRQDNSMSQLRTPLRKRRPINVSGQVGSTGFTSSSVGKQRNLRCHEVSGKEVGLHPHSIHRTCIKSRSGSQKEVSGANGSTETDVISFTFNSSLRHKSGISTELKDKIRNQNDFNGKSVSFHRKLILDENDDLPLSGDALGALLEQKLKELTSQEEDEFVTGSTPPKRTTAMILQELISALTEERPISQDDHMLNTDTAFQSKPRIEGHPLGFSHGGDHFSPGSVLEASFSNDSCFSSSMDESSGPRLHPPDSMDCSYDQAHLLEPDADLLDSATTLNYMTGSEMVIHLVSHISTIYHRMNLANSVLVGGKLIHAKEVILNAELLFGNALLLNSDGMNFLINPLLLDKLETLPNALWADYNCFHGSEEAKDGNQHRGFLFDCLIDYLDSRYGRFHNSGFKAWTRVPQSMSAEILVQEVDEEVRRWTWLAGKIPDDIIEWEMSHGLGKWTDFEIEAFEAGAEMDGDILQVLVEEIVNDICECRLGCSF